MAGRNIHFSNANIFSSLLIASLVLFFLPKSLTSKASLFFRDTFQPVLQIGREDQMETRRLGPNSEDAVSHEDYARLWKSYNNLHAQLMMLHKDYERLANIRSGLPQLSAEGLVMAKITGTVSNYSRELMIDKGSEASVRPGQFVLSERNDAIVGVVSEVSETAAKVRLIDLRHPQWPINPGHTLSEQLCLQCLKDPWKKWFRKFQNMLDLRACVSRRWVMWHRPVPCL